MKKVIVLTGAAGFVGQKLASKLINLDYEVIALDLIDPKIENVNFKHLNIGCDLEIDSIQIPQESIFVHLAAMSTDSSCKESPADAVNINLGGTTRLVELANRNNCTRFIFASSEWVYPEKQDSLPQNETELLNLENLNSLYAITKLMGENIIRTTCNATNISLRFGIVYGPRMKPGSAPESIAFKVSQGEDVTLGAGHTSRRFIFIDDLVDGIIQAIIENAPLKSCIYNLSGLELINLFEIAQTAKEITNKKVKIVDAGGIPSIRNPDPSNFMRDFGFTPRITLPVGLQACLNVMKINA